MKKSLKIFFLTCVMTFMCTAMALAYNPGQRTFQLLGQTLNSDKHPVHLVVTQTIDMKDIYTPEAYAKLEPAKQKHVNRIEYNEANGINAERITTTAGDGTIVKDSVSYVRDGYWYTVDLLHKNYDRIPEVKGVSLPFAETLISWFANRPTAGVDTVTGYDYDKVTKGENELCFYFAKDSEQWMGYKTRYLPFVSVVEVSETVNADEAFALPPADFPQVANPDMRNYANMIIQRLNK